MSVQERLYTADDLLHLPDDGKIYELHNGVLIEILGATYGKSMIAAWIGYLLTAFILEHKLGGTIVGADGTCVLSKYNTRIPDVAYLTEQADKSQDENQFISGAPALAIEVVSPSNTLREMQERAGEYLDAGARLVWIINPEKKTADMYRTDGQRIAVSGDGVLEGFDVLPELKLPLATVFNPYGRT